MTQGRKRKSEEEQVKKDTSTMSQTPMDMDMNEDDMMFDESDAAFYQEITGVSLKQPNKKEEDQEK